MIELGHMHWCAASMWGVLGIHLCLPCTFHKAVGSGSGSHGEVTSTITCEPPQDQVRPSTPPKTWVRIPAHMERLLARSHVSLLKTRLDPGGSTFHLDGCWRSLSIAMRLLLLAGLGLCRVHLLPAPSLLGSSTFPS